MAALLPALHDGSAFPSKWVAMKRRWPTLDAIRRLRDNRDTLSVLDDEVQS